MRTLTKLYAGHTLTRLYAHKMSKQKFIYIFFACFLMASLFYAFLISTPQMEEMLNVDIDLVGKENFPEFMMRFYVGTVGILFQAFLLTMFICEEDRCKMLSQPLLHGENRSSIVKSKIVIAVSISVIFILVVALINYAAAFLRWGRRIFEAESTISMIEKYVLSGIYMSCLSVGIVALGISARNTWKTLVFVIGYLLADSFICNSGSVLKKMWIGHYPNLWMFAYEYRSLPIKETFCGIAVMLAYGIFFYWIAWHRIKKMNF